MNKRHHLPAKKIELSAQKVPPAMPNCLSVFMVNNHEFTVLVGITQKISGAIRAGYLCEVCVNLTQLVA